MTAMSRAALAMHRRRKPRINPFRAERAVAVESGEYYQRLAVAFAHGHEAMAGHDAASKALGVVWPAACEPLPDPGTTSPVRYDPPKRRLSDAESDKFNEHANWLADNLSARARATLVDEFGEAHGPPHEDGTFLVSFGYDRHAMGTLVHRGLIDKEMALGAVRRYRLTPLGAEVRRAVIALEAPQEFVDLSRDGHTFFADKRCVDKIGLRDV